MANKFDISIGKQLEILTTKVADIIDTGIPQLFNEVSKSMKKDSKSIIEKFDRIDTSTMLNTVESFTNFSKSSAIITLESNAIIQGRKQSHSSFNEDGTSRMKGIHFIGDSFNENIKGIENKIDRLISEITI